MILILAHTTDDSAQWLFQKLSKQHKNVLLLTDANLIEAGKWKHRLNNIQTETSFQLKDGTDIDLSNVKIIINRLQYVYPHHWAEATEKEGTYAQQEYHAFFASWLQSFDGLLLNPPTVNNLSGNNPEKAMWLFLAENAGFIIPKNAFYIERSEVLNDVQLEQKGKVKIAVVLEDEIINAPSAYTNACLCLSQKINLPLLCIYFLEHSPAEYFFAGATPLPDFKTLPSKFFSVLNKKIKSAYAN